MAGDGLDVVPASYREGAEEIRAHLVSLRGGAPFLSSSDALLLVRWFDKGVGVLDILQALERAWAARRKQQSRVPFTLGHARRHLGKPLERRPKARPMPSPSDGPLGSLVARVRERAVEDPHQRELLDLADALRQLEGEPEALVHQALGLLRTFRERVWETTPDAVKAELRETVRADLGDLLQDLDEHVALALIEEEAREAARAGYGWLDAASVWDAVEGP